MISRWRYSLNGSQTNLITRSVIFGFFDKHLTLSLWRPDCQDTGVLHHLPGGPGWRHVDSTSSTGRVYFEYYMFVVDEHHAPFRERCGIQIHGDRGTEAKYMTAEHGQSLWTFDAPIKNSVRKRPNKTKMF